MQPSFSPTRVTVLAFNARPQSLNWEGMSIDPPKLPPEPATPQVFFERKELDAILRVYGRMVAAGDWKDYALETAKDHVAFCVFRRATEAPLYRIEKRPALARKQGAWSVLAPGGLVLRRGHELEPVLRLFDAKTLRVVD